MENERILKITPKRSQKIGRLRKNINAKPVSTIVDWSTLYNIMMMKKSIYILQNV